MRDKLDRKLVYNFIAIDIGDGHLSCGDQIELTLVVQLKQIFLKLWQLASAVERLTVNNIGYIDLLVTMLLNMSV